MPAEAAAPANTANAGAASVPSPKGSGDTDTDEPGDPAKHASADPGSTALTLLENALAGALAGAMSGVPAPAPATAAATSASGGSSQDSIAAGNSTASALGALLGESLATDPQANATIPLATAGSPAGGPPAAATPAATATASAAALLAAQLTAGSAVGAAHTRLDAATMTVSSPVGSSAWTDELGAKVTWIAQQGIQSASLQLSPEHLGPLQVTISVHDGQASVWFGAAQPDTRTALQQSLPQLRQLFANQGLTLADAGVSRESPRGQDRQQAQRPAATVGTVTAVTLDASASGTGGTRGLGLVDTYA